MNEKVFLLLLGCVTGLVTSLPLSAQIQYNLLEVNKDAPKSEDSEVPQGIFSKILKANKDSKTPMYGGDVLVQNERSAMNCPSCLWPKSDSGSVLVPYTIDSRYSASDLNSIVLAMAEFETLTCVRFVPLTTEDDYINITPGDGCYSYLGRTGGSQTVSLGGGCIYRGIIQHELEHALGFYHEHVRSDRDNYVDINFQYIPKGKLGNFAKADTNNLGSPYDYGSVMHYDAYAFTNTSNKPTIVPKPDPNVPIGQTIGLSVLDVTKINRLYQCSVCATLLNNKTGIFTSDNYPSAYPDNGDCVWLIRVPSGKASLKFSTFNIQSTPNCDSDYMRIYDGPSKNSPVLLDKICGSQTIPPIIASTSQMLVQFVSDGAVAGVGFQASYSSVKCGGTFFNSQGSFTSPGYPGNYSPNMNCNFTITAPVGNKIALTISDFHLESSIMCMYDYLTLFMDGTQMGPFCGDRTIPVYYSKGNSMVLVFHSDKSTQAKGFQVSYTFSPKSEDSEVPQGIFSQILKANKDSKTPMYGGDVLVQNERSAMNCPSCLWPKSDSGSVLVPYTIDSRYSASDLNSIVLAMAEFETLTCVRFVPLTTEDDYINITPGDGCYSYLGRTGGSQTVSLGGGCIYRGIIQHELEHALGFYHEHVRSDRDNYVDINFQYIPKGKLGNFAKVDTNNLGSPYDYGSVMHYDAYAFTNTSNKPTIVPKPDPNVPIGQTIGLSVLDVTKINRLYQCSVCATLLNNKTGIFTSDNYPSAYPNNGDCVWLIRVPSGKASLKFSNFNIQSTPNCDSDYMRIYDGPSKNSPVLLDKICGSQTIPPIIASTSQMLVQFVSDGAVAGDGFQASYRSVQCGGTFFNSQGSFTSPGYPGNYSPNMNCNFTITAPVGNKIALTISDFHLESSIMCMYDYLTLFMDGTQMGPFCGDRTIPVYYSKGNSMVLVFHSDKSTQAKGFQVSYTFFQ
ncbi:embryonic protein UVS.2-like isoform X2 [Rana temporaria]|uniref:embryonic protein UVS.2-like isoform X2 n=1 Tax=Rana temporaria TaxID=8407 RepID=UPI001AAC5C15|nr:embryonic protein UVS.2-like isoform X2 [Rana temporaria]